MGEVRDNVERSCCALRRTTHRPHAGPHRSAARHTGARSQRPGQRLARSTGRTALTGSDLQDAPVAEYKRRIGPWLLWRAGPATGGDARYWACDEGDLNRQFVFRLNPDGTGEGVGPSGARHERFRAWKENLRDAEVASDEW